MEPCSVDQWDMSIFFGDDVQALVGRPFFRDVKVTGGVITGRVEDETGAPISNLGGLCVSIPGLNISEVSQMTFLFRLKDAQSEIGMFLIGYAFTPSGASKAVFNGKWLAHPPGSDTPAAGDIAPFILPGSGDTGTGTGNQT